MVVAIRCGYGVCTRTPNAALWVNAENRIVGATNADLAALAAQSYGTLSGGERQRARLAQLWAQGPRIMLLDEPLLHLDLRHQLQTLQLLRNATREAGVAAALVLHDLAYAGRCDRILMLHGDGRYAAGNAEDLLQAERLAELYGCSVRAFGAGADTHFVPVI